MELSIKISEIPEKRDLQYSGPLEIEEMPRILEISEEDNPALNFEARLRRNLSTITVQGNVNGRLVLNCDRCLGTFSQDVQSEFNLILLPESEQIHLEPEMLLQITDLDTDYYQGEWLHLNELLEEQILLEIPFRKLCSEDCKGLCSGCGESLNQTECKCPPKDLSDHPFAGLLSSEKFKK